MPHPDDEAVFCAGILQSLTKENIRVTIITVTRGDKSTLRYGVPDGASLSSVRYTELLNSLRLAGVTNEESIHIWEFPDGDVESHVDEIAKKIRSHIATSRPTHLLTLEPDGIYGHPDHIALSALTTTIADEASLPLMYLTVKPGYIFGNSRRMAKKSMITPLIPDYCFHLSVTEVLTKWRMLRAHGSQFRLSLGDFKTYRHFIRNSMFHREYFSIAHPN